MFEKKHNLLEAILFAALCLMLLCLPAKAEAATADDLGYLVWDGLAYVSSCNSQASGELEIPSYYDGKPVVGIRGHAFQGCSGLTHIIIPDTVTQIDEYAFDWCSGLQQVTFSNNLKTIGNCAFTNCSALQAIELPDSLISIGGYAFSGCPSLTSVTVPESVTGIGGGAFASCISLEKAVLPSALTVVSSNLFSGCTRLTSVNIPEAVTIVGEGAFRNCTSLSSVRLPDSVIEIHASAFEGCSRLETLQLGNKLSQIGGTAFKNCINLAKVTLPDSVLTIGGSAFEGCTSLSSIDLGSGVVTIGGYAFSHCIALTSCKLPDSVINLETGVFYQCQALKNVTIGKNVQKIPSWGFRDCKSLTGITIPNQVTKVEGNAFQGCIALTHAVIGNGVTVVGGSAFNGCVNLETVSLGSSIVTIEGSAFLNCSKLQNIVLPDSLEVIGGSAIQGCSQLKTLTVGKKLRQVDGCAFRYCGELNAIYITDLAAWCDIRYDYSYVGSVPLENAHNLYLNGELITDLVIPEGVETIYGCAFLNATNITSVTFPESLQLIGTNSFAGCTQLRSVSFGSNLRQVNASAFNNCSSLSEVRISNLANWCSINYAQDAGTSPLEKGHNLYLNGQLVTNLVIPEGIQTLAYKAFAGCTSITSVTCPESLVTIGASAFYGCSQLRTVSLGTQVAQIQGQAFRYCDSLTGLHIADLEKWMSISYATDAGTRPLELAHNLYINGQLLTDLVIPEGIETIPNGIFKGCTSITSVTFPQSLYSIGENAFCDCIGIREINFHAVPHDIQYRAFYNCDSLTALKLPDGITSLGNNVFQDCDALVRVVLGSGLTSIPSYAFADCDALNAVFIPDGVTTVYGWAFSGCGRLKSLTMPASLTRVENYGFRECRSLTHICYRGTQIQWKDMYKGTYNMLDGIVHYEADVEAVQNVESCVGAGAYCTLCATFLTNDPLPHTMCNGVCLVCGLRAVGMEYEEGATTYLTLTKILQSVPGGYVRLGGDLYTQLTLEQDAWLDLNGYNIFGDITITENAMLYLFDSATADFTGENRGKIVGTLKGNIARSMNTPASYGHNYKYMVICEDDGSWSAHRYYLAVYSVVLNPYAKDAQGFGAAINYKTTLKCNSVAASYIASYGAKMQGDNTVYADHMDFDYVIACGAEERNIRTTMLQNVMRLSNNSAVNGANAVLAPNACAFITLTDGTELNSASIAISFKEILQQSLATEDLSASEQRALGNMYLMFRSVIDLWTDVDLQSLRSFAGVEVSEEPAFRLVTNASDFTSGTYVMTVNNGYAPLNWSDGWVPNCQPVVTGEKIENAQGATWFLNVDRDRVTITDSFGTTITPKGGNVNGISSGEYQWKWEFRDGAFVFSGTGNDAVYFACNSDEVYGQNRFRGYKMTTVNAYPETYLCEFSLYKAS